MAIRTVIFDLGGVLVGYDWTAFLMKKYGDEETVEKMKDALFRHGVWNEVDRGVWSEEELLQGFYQYGPGLEDKLLDFWNTAGGALWQYDFTKNLLREVKATGVQMLYLSNWSQHMVDQAGDILDFLPMFDGGVFSFKEHLIKPDHAIYERILEKYHLNREECVFLDDNAKNVAASRECGIRTIHVTDHEEAKRELFTLI